MQLTLDNSGFYTLPIPSGAPVAYVSPDGSDAAAGTEAAPLQTLAAARRKLAKGKPGAILLRSGGRWVNQQLWIDGGTNDAPHVVATYGGTERAVVDCAVPPAGEDGKSALQVRGAAFVSDIEFVCEPGRSGCNVRGGNYDFVAQNVLVRDAGLGFDFSAVNALLHRTLVLDCYDPKGDKSQGVFQTEGGRLTAFQSVFHRCGWRPGVPLTFFASDKNHCIYIHQSAGPTLLEECFIGEPCSHGSQLRSGGTVRKCVYYRCPIGGFAQNAVGLIEDTYFEQQDAIQLGQGTAPDGQLRGWGWETDAAYHEVTRVAFKGGGLASPTSRALNLSKFDVERGGGATVVQPRLFARGVRVRNWVGSAIVTAPAADVGEFDVEVDATTPRADWFTVDPHVATLRTMGRGSDWTLTARLSQRGYESLESVRPARPLRTALIEASKKLHASAAELEKLVGY